MRRTERIAISRFVWPESSNASLFGLGRLFHRRHDRNRISEILSNEFNRFYGRPPAPEEYRSWTNSLVRMKDVLQEARLRDNGVLLEYYLLPSSKRLDFLVTGADPTGTARAEIVELKQWDRCESVDEPNEVLTEVGHGKRMVPHPSVQVAGYHQWLLDMHSAFYEENPIQLGSCTVPP